MQPDNNRREDFELRSLLEEWEAPRTPASLEARVLDSIETPRSSWWRFLLTGYIRVPVPVACALALFVTGGIWKLTSSALPQPCSANQIAASQVHVKPASDRCGHLVSGGC